jgi:hypothetical protein
METISIRIANMVVFLSVVSGVRGVSASLLVSVSVGLPVSNVVGLVPEARGEWSADKVRTP